MKLLFVLAQLRASSCSTFYFRASQQSCDAFQLLSLCDVASLGVYARSTSFKGLKYGIVIDEQPDWNLSTFS